MTDASEAQGESTKVGGCISQIPPSCLPILVLTKGRLLRPEGTVTTTVYSYQSLIHVTTDVNHVSFATKVEHLLRRLRELGAAPSREDREKERREEELTGGFQNSPNLRTWRWVRPKHKKTPPKAIVYSGFRTHLSVIDLALTSAGVNFENIARMGMTRFGKDAALARFRYVLAFPKSKHCLLIVQSNYSHLARKTDTFRSQSQKRPASRGSVVGPNRRGGS
jgi:hypothetical protein